MEILKNVIKHCQSSRLFRKRLAYYDHQWFFTLYLPHYLGYDLARFHQEMFSLSQKKDNKLLVVQGFRGCGKSTILNLSLVIWSIIGKPKKKFILIISKNVAQAKLHLNNIYDELKNNELLNNDFYNLGLKRPNGSSVLVIEKYQAKIIASQCFKSLRGIKNGANRPDLIICDDIDDEIMSEKPRSREKLKNWFNSEVIPLGSEKTKIVVLGSPVNFNCLIRELTQKIKDNTLIGEARLYPFFKNGKTIWPEKYNSEDKISELRNSVLNQETWNSEYLLSTSKGMTMSDLLDMLENDSKAINETETSSTNEPKNEEVNTQESQEALNKEVSDKIEEFLEKYGVK